MKKPKVTVIGLGYVGLPLYCAIAKSGLYDTWGLELSKKKLDLIRNRESPVEDKQAIEDLKTIPINVTDDESVLRESDYVTICVPTPINEETDSPDLTPVIKATEAITRHLGKNPKQNIILESSVYPGVCDNIVKPILERSGLKGGLDFELAHCPERIDPGNEKYNVYNIARTIGAFTPEGRDTIAEFYRSFLNPGVEIVKVGSPKEAELSKELENTFRYFNIALVNYLAPGCDRDGIDLVRVLKAASTKPFGFMPHWPSCGVGGHCLPKDTRNLRHSMEKLGINSPLLTEAIKVNESMPAYTVEKLEKGLSSRGLQIKGSDVGLLGLAYKAGLSDMRDSPALVIRSELEQRGARVKSYDPLCNGNSTAKLDEILTQCPGVIVATAHNMFKEIDNWENVQVIVDGMNCLDGKKIEQNGVYYVGIGRGK